MVVAAVIDGLWALQGGDAHRPSLVRFAAFDLGVIFPAMLALAAPVGAFALFIEPDRAHSLSELIALLRPRAAANRARMSLLLPALTLATFLWTTAVAHLGKWAMATIESPMASGLVLSAGTLALGAAALATAFGVVQLALRATDERDVDPLATLGGGVLFVLALFAWGIASGTTSGEGGWLGIWGVLKRPSWICERPRWRSWSWPVLTSGRSCCPASRRWARRCSRFPSR